MKVRVSDLITGQVERIYVGKDPVLSRIMKRANCIDRNARKLGICRSFSEHLRYSWKLERGI